MGSPVVTFDKVWKKFRTGGRHDSLRDLIPAAATRWFRRSDAMQLSDKEFWALRGRDIFGVAWRRRWPSSGRTARASRPR